MKKSKSIQTLDRLSELPDSLIFNIFRFLSMRIVIATAVLSKRWRSLWTTTPYLNFTEYMSGDADFINWTLMFWRGSTKIHKFKIDSFQTFNPFSYSHIDMWLRFAKDHEVEELYLNATQYSDEQYTVPQYLFSSCSSLKVLSLESCTLDVQRNVQWNQLKSLYIYSEHGLTHDAINRILLGSPQLEVLVLKFFEVNEHLTIRSTSMKKLSIKKLVWHSEEEETPLPHTRLIIWTPNLETFEISHAPYFYCSMENVSSLTHISLLFDDVDEETLKQILPRIQHVENVSLSKCCIEVLLSLRNKNLAPRLLDAKFLKLTSYFSDHKQIACVLEMFSKVKTLVLEDGNAIGEYGTISYFDFQPSLPSLTRVEVSWDDYHDESIFILIEMLLKYASSLEMMVFRLRGNCWNNLSQHEWMVLASEKLQRMQRASPTAKLIVCDQLYP